MVGIKNPDCGGGEVRVFDGRDFIVGSSLIHNFSIE